MKISLSMAQGRKASMLNIGYYKTPLADVIMQIYLWSHTQTEQHWRKELRAIIKNIMDNVDTGKGLLKKKDIVQSLDNVAIETVISKRFRGMLKDPDYSELRTERVGPPLGSQMQNLIEVLAKGCLSDADEWEVSDSLISEIESW